MTGSSQASVFSESDVSDVVGLVFDFPVIPPELLELSGTEFHGGATGDGDLNLPGDFDFLKMMGGSNDHGGLSGVRKVDQVVWAELEDEEFPGVVPSVSLIQLDVTGRKKKESSRSRSATDSQSASSSAG